MPADVLVASRRSLITIWEMASEWGAMTAAPTADGPAKVIVRHGAMRLLGEFAALTGGAPSRGARVVIRTDRGLELGEVLCPSTPQAVAHLPEPTHGDIVRPMSDDDRRREDQLRETGKKQFETAG